MEYNYVWDPMEFGYVVYEEIKEGRFKGRIPIAGFVLEGHAREYAAWRQAMVLVAQKVEPR
jgi:hypothetical protein